MKAFSKRYPHIADRVPGLPPKDIETASWRRLTSDPERLIKRWLSSYCVKADTAIALSGVGDGSHLLALRQCLPPSGLVFCAERDVSRFRAFLDTAAAGVLMADERFLFGVGKLDDAFYRSLASFLVMEFSSAEPLIFAPLFSEDESYYSTFFLEFARQFEMWRKMFGTNLTQSGLWQKNTFANLRDLVTSPDPIAFQAAFEGVPLVMAGAGPSLDESLDFLRWAQDRAVIVAGNSSIRSLVRGGVRPHFVLAADPNETTDSGFEGVNLGESILLCPFLVYPPVVKRFREKVSAWAFGNPVATYFRSVAGSERTAFFSEQGTVSACAFDLAVILGCPAIFFVGQDLAARADGRMHAEDSFYAELSSDKVELDRCRWLPGNTIEKVPVEEKLYVYLKTFEELSRAYSQELKLKNGKGLSLFNLSRLGARIAGIPYLTLEKAPSILDSFRSGRVDQGWARIQSIRTRHQASWGQVDEALEAFRSYVTKICSFALREALALEMEERSLEEVEVSRAKLIEMMTADQAFELILNEGQLKMELHVHRRAEALLDRRRDASSEAARFESAVSYFWAVAEGSYQALASLEATCIETAGT